MAPNIRRHVN